MKKRILTAVIAVCTVVSAAALFSGCSEIESEISSSSSTESGSAEDSSVATDYKIITNTEEVLAFTATQDVLTLTDSTSVKDYLDALVTLGQITYEGTESSYGYYITAVNGNAEEYADTYMTYWSLYTSLFILDGVTYATSDYGSYDLNGQTLGYANYGVTSMPCIEGCTYALVYSIYTYPTKSTDYKIITNTEEVLAFTATQDVLTLTDSTSVKNYLDALVTLGQITYEGTESSYGYYITAVNGNAEEYADTYMTYWSLYTSLYTLDGVTYATSDYGSYDLNGQTLGYANYGVTSMPCIEGCTYALVYSTYTYPTNS